ncbi:hypothetical protein [uncultured Amnibacterium sp.]
MSDPKPADASDTAEDGAADNTGGIEAAEVNPEVPWVDPEAD